MKSSASARIPRFPRRRGEPNEMIDEGESIEVNCHFCSRHYNFSVEELTDIRDRAVR